MARPPASRVREEARIWFNKSLDECTDDERLFCEDMAWDYCGMSPMEAAEEDYMQKHGMEDGYYDDSDDEDEEIEEEE